MISIALSGLLKTRFKLDEGITPCVIGYRPFRADFGFIVDYLGQETA